MTNDEIPRTPSGGRDRGILSEADRAYLRGEKDLSTQSERDARYRIRNRVRDGILDFHLLATLLGDDDRKQIFNHLGPFEVTDTIKFLYKGSYDTNDDIDDTNEMFEMAVTRAITDSLVELDPDHIIEDVSVDINISRTTPELDELREKFDSGDETIEELRYLLRHGDIDEDSVKKELASRVIENADVETNDDGEMRIQFHDYADLSAFLDATQINE